LTCHIAPHAPSTNYQLPTTNYQLLFITFVVSTKITFWLFVQTNTTMSKNISHDAFLQRHIGPNAQEQVDMLAAIGADTLEQLIAETVPASIRMAKPLNMPDALSEHAYLSALQGIAAKNKVFRSYIGQGYHGTVTPSVILRNIFQNPGWYTQYTPYQAEIAQGRLEALLNFQTVVCDLTGLPVANASLLDESTAAAEAMNMFFHVKNKKTVVADEFLVSDGVLPQTLEVLRTRAQPLGIKVKTVIGNDFKLTDKTFGILLQYPTVEGQIGSYQSLCAEANERDIYVTVATDLLSLTLLTPPGEWGAHCAVGNSQRFGVPMGFGGPHAAFFATKDDFKRLIPGRIIGMSVDSHGRPAMRMALQTREQHIRRDKATSNICTAQALLAIMAGMYAAWHGPEGLRAIANQIHQNATTVADALNSLGYSVRHKDFFDTVAFDADAALQAKVRRSMTRNEINLRYAKGVVSVALDETMLPKDLTDLIAAFADAAGKLAPAPANKTNKATIAQARASEFMTHPVFHTHRTESQMMRYIKRLENKDLSLTHSMISLGSCTMKLNAASELIPVSWPAFANMHPQAPANQTKGYDQMTTELSQYLCEVTGFDACSLQPNSGAQGEYAGLLTIRNYLLAKKQAHRTIALIPSSAHGTNPASAVMVGMEVVVVACDESGNIDLVDLNAKAEQHKDKLACLMVTYPSTHGVFESAIQDICAKIHEFGGLVYMDGANMNAQVGLTSPALIGADVCHLNLHKTFAIPHGGGGPGMGPICCTEALKPHLPGHLNLGNKKGAVSGAAFGSASILLISYGYIRMLGGHGLTEATRIAILNANYMKVRLEKAYQILYTGEQGRAAHEMILDMRPFKAFVSAEDIAKRLMDYGFHAPTLSFPVAGTIMIEPTESEDKGELDRFCDAMLAIRQEIDEVANGDYPADSNVFCNAPHTQYEITADVWTMPYSREKAAFPLPYLREGYKFWPSVSRIDAARGDRNLICTCPSIESYQS
jgi:glycine dehydrogenase